MKGITASNKKPRLVANLKKPIPKNGEVLIKVNFTTLNPTDVSLIENSSFIESLFVGKNDDVKSGLEFSGIVQSNGLNFKIGNKVFGYVNLLKGNKAHQEYVVMDEQLIAKIPSNVSLKNAASIPLGAQTAYAAVYETAKINKSHNVLINGASGGVGVYVTQFVKLLGANVTAVDGPSKKRLLTGLKVDNIINYQKQNITELSEKYDVIFDLTTKLKMNQIKHLLKQKGQFIPFDPFKNTLDFILSLFSSKKARFLMEFKGNTKKLDKITKLFEEKKLTYFVDSVFDLKEYKKAFERIKERGRKGRILIKM